MGGKQLGFSDYELTTAKKQTKRESTIVDATLIAAPSSTKTNTGSGIRKCTRPRRATSGISG
jgi:transposase, IS5 family